jgi:hypothetical protein
VSIPFRSSLLLALLLSILGWPHVAVSAQNQVAVDVPVRPSGKEKPSSPKAVTVGIYVIQVSDIDLQKNTFKADFYIWFRWTDFPGKPLDTFEVMNGTIDKKEVQEQKARNGSNYAFARVTATINSVWDLSRFPIDKHQLIIQIEDTGADKDDLVYQIDAGNSTIDPNVDLAGWVAKGLSGTVGENRYETTYGDPDYPPGHTSTFSRARFVIPIERPDHGTLYKVLFVVLVCAGVAYSSLLVPVEYVDPRFGLGVGALFAIIASEFIFAGMVPFTGALTIADKLHLLTCGAVLFSIVVSVFSLRQWHHDRRTMSLWIDRTAMVVFPPIYVVGVMAAMG